jgi:hypothetical protein
VQSGFFTRLIGEERMRRRLWSALATGPQMQRRIYTLFLSIMVFKFPADRDWSAPRFDRTGGIADKA